MDSEEFPVIVVVKVLLAAIWFRSIVEEVIVVPLGSPAEVGKSSVVELAPPGKVNRMILPGWVIKMDVPFELVLKPC